MTDLPLPPDVPLKAISKELREVAKLCGVATAAALVQHYGGTRMWVPKHWRPEHDLNDIGEDLARVLFEYFGASELSIPRTLYTAAGRRDMIRRLSQQGHRQRDIARLLRCSQRVVRDELGGRPRPVMSGRRRAIDPRQIDLEDLLRAGK